MKALDSNILIRFLVKDDERQAEIVYSLFKRAESEKDSFFVPLLVVLETIGVLESVYEVSPNDILDAFRELLSMPLLKFESQPAVQAFVSSAKEHPLDLSDLLIAQSAHHSGCEKVLTLDKQAAKSAILELVG